MDHLQRILLLGTGPATIQLAILFKKYMKCHVGIVGRDSVRSTDFFEALERSERRIQADVQNEQHRRMKGECIIDQIFHGYETIEGEWDTYILAVTTDAYVEVLDRIHASLLHNVRCTVLISPTFGSNSLVSNYLRRMNIDVEVISFSTYLGDTRWLHGIPSNQVITTGIKKKVFIGSTQQSSAAVHKLRSMFETLGIALEEMATPFEAETRNISLYVHPPLFMNEFTLGAIFDNPDTPKYVYKLYPEGPITQYLIRDMLSQWKEIMDITDRLNIQKLNLLRFMTDDNYPVRTESLSRNDIDRFNKLEAIHQEYLLYIRYSSLLIDPFSEPDADGKYFDFSAVPIRSMFLNKEGCLDIPRMPKEDYYRIKVIRGIAHYLELRCPTIDRFVKTYEHKITEVAQAHQGELLSDAFTVQDFQEHISMICREIAHIRS
ncbi:opine metallophore biosynthesis dehydrogenase [Paenibacillus sp. J22TS3]|uniref:opine metallophore biosynthesis dehydrogenase n=1 Tax=Paenibacillus sp. J22TS3 TaxID=2807192 RepID=UPI001B0BFC8D|nr:opine metallophore biosynthesis dehydrogenase [Paenibacillus sp. J22TS3]GIP19741.1 staphylopine dehydrogenase CntM [Paenibacillus sp. J22TS3]